MRAVTGAVAFAMGLALLGASAPASNGETEQEQFRAFWVDAFNEGIYSPDEVDELVEAAVAGNHNAIIAQVVRRADCFCNDALPPRTQAPIDPEPFDPLAELVERAHAQGLEVHAWMNMNTMWNLPDPPAADDHRFNTNGPGSGDPWLNVRVDGATNPPGTHNYFFDPGHPDAMAYIVDTAVSIVEAYDVDGINLDYIRYPDYQIDWETHVSHWGYNDVALERFQAATGRDDRPEPDDEQWAQWRRDQVTGVVRRIYLEVFAADPTVAVSANTITYGEGPEQQGGWEASRPYTETLQDFRGWMEEGILDLNVPMNYKRDWDPDQRQWYRQWNEFVADHQYDRHAVVGSALYLNDIDDSVAQIRAALAPSEAGNEVVGWTGYSYANSDQQAARGAREAEDSREELRRATTEPSEYDPETLAGLAEPVFAEKAAVPERTWRTRPTHGHVRGLVRTGDGDPLDTVTVHAMRQGDVVASTQTDGQGWFGFVDLEPGRHRLTVDPDDARGVQPAHVVVDAGRLHSADLVARP